MKKKNYSNDLCRKEGPGGLYVVGSSCHANSRAEWWRPLSDPL